MTEAFYAKKEGRSWAIINRKTGLPLRTALTKLNAEFAIGIANEAAAACSISPIVMFYEGGSSEREMHIKDVKVPDIWHLLGRLTQKGYISEEEREMLWECHGIANFLRRHIQAECAIQTPKEEGEKEE